MARKNRFGSTKKMHKLRARIHSAGMKAEAKAVSQDLKRGMCGPALTNFTALAIEVGRLRAERRGYTGKLRKRSVGAVALRKLARRINHCYLYQK
jgi:hypothetical protein